MPENLSIFYFILAVVNIVAFILVGVDKKRSVYDQQRVPEVYLFFISIFFASLGVLIGMYYFHHKTKKAYFPIGLSLLMIQQGLLLTFLLQKIATATMLNNY